MDKITLIIPEYDGNDRSGRLEGVIRHGLSGLEIEILETVDQMAMRDLRERRILFAVALGNSGINLEMYRMIRYIRAHKNLFDGSVAGMVLDGNSELFTKSVARDLVFSANRSGCTFPGRPLVEGTGSLLNFTVIAKIHGLDNLGAYRYSVRALVERVLSYKPPVIRDRKPRLLALHAGNAMTSNTLGLWHLVREGLDCDVKEISLRDGQIWDCRGCSYETCLHLGEKQNCFYGGVMTQEVYPAIGKCDGLVMVCPNYNDAISANLSAFVNRLTAIFRVRPFYDKRVFAVIVSGYSGSDIVAQQLISGLNMNKSFILPSRFALMETANNPGTVMDIKGIKDNAAEFADTIMKEFQS